MKGRVFNITRCSLHDGEGIRTVVYFKGCNLKCQWCHNPEGISSKIEIVFHKGRCIKCGRCVKICPSHHYLSGDDIIYERSADCDLCMKCVEECPNEALVECGKYMTVDEIYDQIIKDKFYYESSGGGVTFSGGEALLQIDLLLELLKKCKSAEINTTLETAFNICWENIETVMGFIDTFIIDIKHSDSDMHKTLTGAYNTRILSNISKLSKCHPLIIIRIPLIPGLNDDDENLIQTAGIINNFGSGIKAVELLKYNNMLEGKYIAIGKKHASNFGFPQNDKVMQQKRALMAKYIRANIEVV